MKVSTTSKSKSECSETLTVQCVNKHFFLYIFASLLNLILAKSLKPIELIKNVVDATFFVYLFHFEWFGFFRSRRRLCGFSFHFIGQLHIVYIMKCVYARDFTPN